nr:hypothetical protein [Chloroflexaceae bacterium]
MHILINGSFWHQPTVGSGQYVHGLARWLPQVGPQHRYTLLVPATAMAQAPAPPPGVRLLPLRTPFDGRNDNLAKLWFEQVSVPTAARIIATVGKQTPGAQRRGAEVQRRRDLILRTAYCVLRAETYASFASFADRLPSPVSRLRSPVSGLPSPVLLHIPYFAPPLRCAVPVVTTVGDIIPLLLPEYRGGRHVQAYMALVQRAV